MSAVVLTTAQIEALTPLLEADPGLPMDGAHPVGASGLDFDLQSAFYVGLEVGRVIGPTHEAMLRRFLAEAQNGETPCFGRLASTYRAFDDNEVRTHRAVAAFKQGVDHCGTG
jgi:hypothetical protein